LSELDLAEQEHIALLLPYQVTEGWHPLCAFLEVSEPDEPFPKRNEKTDFLASAPEWAKKIMDENRKERENIKRSDDEQ
jgi:hypothetical protein